MSWGRRAWGRFRGWPIWAQALVALFLIGLVVSPFTSDSEKADRATPVTTTGATATTAPAASTPSTTASTTADPASALQASLAKELGKSNRDSVKRVEVKSADPEVVVKWAINENVTDGLTKNQARRETVQILKVIRDFKRVDWTNVTLVGTYSLVDKLGNASEDRVFLGNYSRATVDSINFDGFDFKNAWEIAEAPRSVHPSFAY